MLSLILTILCRFVFDAWAFEGSVIPGATIPPWDIFTLLQSVCRVQAQDLDINKLAHPLEALSIFIHMHADCDWISMPLKLYFYTRVHIYIRMSDVSGSPALCIATDAAG